MGYVASVLFVIAGIFGAVPAPWQNRTVSWVLVGIAGLVLALPLR